LCFLLIKMRTPRHVLIVRTDHLGDMLLTLPAAEVLKTADPECRITVLASAANVVAALHHPAVDRVEVDVLEAKGSGMRELSTLVRQIRALHCDAAVVAHPTARLAWALWLAPVPIRIGTAYRAYSLLFNRRVREHRRKPPWKHESEHTVNLLRPLGVRVDAVPPPRWRIAAHELADADSVLAQRAPAARRRIALHPGNAGSAMNWSAEQYAELGRQLAAAQDVAVLVTGGPQERQLTGRVAAAIGPAAVDLGGCLTLPQLAALLSRCALYVGSSTGPTHLAAAVGTPVVALYSPLRSSAPARWGPRGDAVRVLQPDVGMVCRTCLGPRCPYYHCMDKHVQTEQVAQHARMLIETRNHF
jgi:ADP-heptose:LPS heptosyltransferase